MDGSRFLISTMGTMRVSEVRFRSTHLKTLSTSPARGPLVVSGPLVVAGVASGQGHRLVLAESVGRTSPTSAHTRHISVRYSGIQKMIYI
jgi:hypothetical protein